MPSNNTAQRTVSPWLNDRLIEAIIASNRAETKMRQAMSEVELAHEELSKALLELGDCPASLSQLRSDAFLGDEP